MRGTANVFVVLFLTICLGSCGGGRASTGAPAAGPLGGALPALSSLDALRGTSVLTDNPIAGKAALDFSSGCSINGENMELRPAPAPDFEWAIYGFTPEYPLAGLRVDYSAGQGGFWLAVGDYPSGRWQIFGPYSGSEPISLDLSSGVNLSPGGSCYCAALAYGQAATVSQVTFITDLPDTQLPTAVLQVSPSEVDKGAAVLLDGTQSSDPDGVIVKYEWDSDGDGSFETATGTLDTLNITASNSGPFTLQLRVTDNSGAHATATANLLVHGFIGPELPDTEAGHQSAIFPSLAVVDGRPAIAYGDWLTDSLYYVRALDAYGVEWGEPIEIGHGGPLDPVTLLVVDGKPAVATSGPYDELFGIYFIPAADADGTSWSAPVPIATQDKHLGGSLGGESCMAIINGKPAVSYTGSSSKTLYYAQALDAAGSSWGAPVDLQKEKVYETSLRFVNGKPSIAFRDLMSPGVKYVRALDADGAAWGAEQQISSNGVQYPRLFIADGFPAISCNSGPNNSMVFIRAQDADGLLWNTPLEIDPTNGSGEDSSPVIFNGVPAISYLGGDWGTVDLCLVSAIDPAGQNWHDPLTVDSEGSVGEGSSMAVVSGGLGIAYHNYDTKQLCYIWGSFDGGVVQP